MRLSRTITAAMLTASALALAACSSDEPSATPSATETTEPAGDNGNTGGNAGGGSATVTIDGETWEFTGYLCVRGYDKTQSDVYSFSSTSRGDFGDAKLQFLVDVRDTSGEDRISGNGVLYEITLFDYGNPTSPTVDYQLSAPSGVTIDGNSVTASGEFTDFDLVAHQVEVTATCG